MPTHIKSFGFRHGPPEIESGSLIVDVRKVLYKNPHSIPELEHLHGDHPEVIKFLEKTPNLDKNYHRILSMVSKVKDSVYIGCTGGKHRSVYIANRLGTDLDLPVEHLNYTDK